MKKSTQISIIVLSFIIILLNSNIPSSFARPITEPTEANQLLLNKYYKNYVAKEGYKLGLYIDVEPTSDLSLNILTLRHLGIFPKDQKFFYPEKPVTPKEFIEWYLFTFNSELLKISADEYLKLTSEKQIEYLNSIKKNSLSKEILSIISQFSESTLDYSVGYKALGLLNTPLKQKKNLLRKDLVNGLIQKLNKDKKLKKLQDKAFGYKTPILSKNKLPEITLDKNFFYIDGQIAKGIFVNWFIKGEKKPKEAIEKMKSFNVIGVSLEIGWDEIEKEEGKLVFPKYFDDTLDLLAKNGMYVHLLISPHYTPKWVFKKYGTDIRMVDINGTPREEGEYAKYSYESPAVEDQIRFQKAAVKHYASFPSVISFLLGNEQSYGRTYDLDYSSWVDQAWKIWLKNLKLPVIEIPKDQKDPNYYLFKRFRQVSVNNYFTKIYDEVKPAQKRVPISFKFIPYENTSAFAPNYGLHLSPLEIKTDFLAIDIYGHTSNVYGLNNSFELPKVIIETNLPGDWSAELMTKYLLINYIKGFPLQSIFAWIEGNYENSLLLPDGTLWQKTYALNLFSKIARAIDNPIIEQSNVAIIIPSSGLSIEGHEYKKYQYQLDNLIDKIYFKTGNFPTLLWSDDVFSNNTNKSEKLWDKKTLENYKEIIIFPSPYDNMRFTNNDINTKIYNSPEEYR